MSKKPTDTHINSSNKKKLPILSLLVLAASCFIVILTETLPAGLLLPISDSLNISEAMAGQLVTSYALGSLVAAMPLSIATRTWDRRTVLIISISAFAVINFLTSITSNYLLMLLLRFLVGMSAGLLWSIIAGYAARIVKPEFQGRAIAISMVGTPLALSLGLPASTFLGELVGWRIVFSMMSVLGVLLIVLILSRMPKLPGQDTKTKLTLYRVFALPGMIGILLTLFLFIISHNILYTYIGPITTLSGLSNKLSSILLVFGICSLISIALIGILVDKHLRVMMLSSLFLFILASFCLTLWTSHSLIIYFAVSVWGLGYGGSATLFQTATARTAGADIDVAQSMTVVAWNLSIGGGGVIGGLCLVIGPEALPAFTLPLLFIALVTVLLNSKHGFR